MGNLRRPVESFKLRREKPTFSNKESSDPTKFYFLILFSNCAKRSNFDPFPSSWTEENVSQENERNQISKAKRQEKKEVEGLVTEQTSTLQGLHMSTHNYGISSKSRVHPLGDAPCIPPQKSPLYTSITFHFPCLPDIQTSFLQAVLHCINPPLPWPTH